MSLVDAPDWQRQIQLNTNVSDPLLMAGGAVSDLWYEAPYKDNVQEIFWSLFSLEVPEGELWTVQYAMAYNASSVCDQIGFSVWHNDGPRDLLIVREPIAKQPIMIDRDVILIEGAKLMAFYHNHSVGDNLRLYIYGFKQNV